MPMSLLALWLAKLLPFPKSGPKLNEFGPKNFGFELVCDGFGRKLSGVED